MMPALYSVGSLLAKGDRTPWIELHRAFHKSIFDLPPKKVLMREILRLLTLTDRYRSLVMESNPREQKGAQERSIVEALATRDRERLLKVFEQERSDIEKNLLSSLRARGL